MSVWDSLAVAIAIEEGYYTPGTPAARNHNPGNLTTTAAGNPLAVFPDDATGWAALYSYVQRHFASYPQISLIQFFGGVPSLGWPGYAPAGHGNNDPVGYASFVAGQLTANGFPTDPNSLLGDIASGTTSQAPIGDPAATGDDSGAFDETIPPDSGTDGGDDETIVYWIGGAGLAAVLLSDLL